MDERRFNRLAPDAQKKMKQDIKIFDMAANLRERYDIPENTTDYEIFQDYAQKYPQQAADYLGDLASFKHKE